MQLKDIEKPLGIGLVVSVFALSFMILQPFAIAIAWGGLIAFASWPLHQRLSRLLRSHVTSGLVLSSIMLALIVGPLVGLGFGLMNDGRDMFAPLVAMTKMQLPGLPDWVLSIPVVGESVVSQWQQWEAKGTDWFQDIVPYLQTFAKFLFSHSGVLGSLVMQAGLAVLFALWFYLQGEQIASALRQILGKVMGSRYNNYWIITASTVQNVINGILGTALVQGILAGIGFAIAGVPGALILGVLTFVLAIIPMGPPLAWVPATAWLVYQGEMGSAIFMGIWGLVVISGIDNILKPILIGRGSVMPLSIVLLGVLGGMIAFGFLGLFLGPVLLALSFTLIKEWLAQQSTP